LCGQLEKYLRRANRVQDCLEWMGCFNSDGYPRAGNKYTTNLKVHREVFNLTHGYYPEVVRHSCDNIKCINPEHLHAGTPIDNVRDRDERGRTFNQVLEKEKALVLKLRDSGLYMREIAEELNIKCKRVEYILTRARKEGY
jgi:hypothetical protein